METQQQAFLQPHHPQSEIKSAYDNTKRALSGGLVKIKEQTNKEARKASGGGRSPQGRARGLQGKGRTMATPLAANRLSCAAERHTDG